MKPFTKLTLSSSRVKGEKHWRKGKIEEHAASIQPEGRVQNLSDYL